MRNRLLVDGNNLWQRSIHAANGKGFGQDYNSGAITIAINLLARYCRSLDPEEILVAWDAGYTFRKSVLPEYKSNRPISTSEIPGYSSEFAELLNHSGIYQRFVAGWEADDLIGRASRAKVDEGVTTYILSGDKDLMQLVTDSVHIIRLPDLNPLTPYDVEVKMGVKPEHLRYYLALVGDSSDNVKGVPGVGPKKAVKMLSEADWDFGRLVDALPLDKREDAIRSLLVVDLISDDIYQTKDFEYAITQPVPRDSSGRKFPLTQSAHDFLKKRGFDATIDKWLAGLLWTNGSDESLWNNFQF